MATTRRATGRKGQGRGFRGHGRALFDPASDTWPESMRRELTACHTPADRQAWAIKWGAFLNGQAQRDRRVQRPTPRPPIATTACGRR